MNTNIIVIYNIIYYIVQPVLRKEEDTTALGTVQTDSSNAALAPERLQFTIWQYTVSIQKVQGQGGWGNRDFVTAGC